MEIELEDFCSVRFRADLRSGLGGGFGPAAMETFSLVPDLHPDRAERPPFGNVFQHSDGGRRDQVRR